MKNPILLAGVLCLMASGCALMLSGCATAGGLQTAETALQAAGMTVDAYCTLAPEGRAALRERLNLPHLIRCRGD